MVRPLVSQDMFNAAVLGQPENRNLQNEKLRVQLDKCVHQYTWNSEFFTSIRGMGLKKNPSGFEKWFAPAPEGVRCKNTSRITRTPHVVPMDAKLFLPLCVLR